MKLSEALNTERLLSLAYQSSGTSKRAPNANELLVCAQKFWLRERDRWFMAWSERIAARWPGLLLERYEDCFELVDEFDQRYYEDTVASSDCMADDESVIQTAACCLTVRLFWRLFNSGQVGDIEMTPEEAARWIERHQAELQRRIDSCTDLPLFAFSPEVFA